MTVVSLEDRVAFLRSPAAYGGRARQVEAVETHTSWVFLAGPRVYKLKKPIRLPFLDFTALSARERNCRDELRLNRRLAPSIYLEVVTLTQQPDGSLRLQGDGEVVDWLVVMQRLPQDRMLDVMLSERRLKVEQIHELAGVLAGFYLSAERADVRPDQVIHSFLDQQALNRQVLVGSAFDVDHAAIGSVMAAVDRLFADVRSEIEARVAGGRYLEGHGDLRPEHVCFTQPLAIFDCLEFSRTLRIIDPFDEIAFLGMECAFLGAAWVEDVLKVRMKDLLRDDISDALFSFYTAFRALMRARMALGHLYFGSSTDIEKWQAKTDHYIRLASRYLGIATAPVSQGAS